MNLARCGSQHFSVRQFHLKFVCQFRIGQSSTYLKICGCSSFSSRKARVNLSEFWVVFVLVAAQQILFRSCFSGGCAADGFYTTVYFMDQRTQEEIAIQTVTNIWYMEMQFLSLNIALSTK